MTPEEMGGSPPLRARQGAGGQVPAATCKCSSQLAGAPPAVDARAGPVSRPVSP